MGKLLTLTPMMIMFGLFFTFFWAQFALEAPFLLFMLGCMFLIGILSLISRPILSFSILVSFILALGFLNVGLSWMKHIDPLTQGTNIQIQVIITLGVILSWYCGYSIQNFSKDFSRLKEEVQQLQKIEGETGVLTFNEFLTKAQFLYTGLKRRKEMGYFVKIQLISKEPAYKAKIINEKLSKLILKSIRAEFDIACHLSSSTVLIFLNNTNETGVEVVMKRIHHSLIENNLNPHNMKINYEQILDNWEETHSLIQSWKGEEKIA